MSQDASKIHIGAGRIWTGVTAPATGNPPTMMPHTGGVPASGIEVGHTSGASTFTYTPTKADIESEQAFGVVDTYLTTESVTLEFTMQERNFNALKTAFDNMGNVSDGAKIMFYGGGVYTVGSSSIMLSSARRDNPAKFEVLVIYKAQSLDPVPIAYSRTAVSMIKAKLRGVHDTSRNVGDQLFQWYHELG